jgi:hypothetical protein
MPTATGTPLPPSPTATPTASPTAAATPTPHGTVSGEHAGLIAAVGATDSYTFTASSGGWAVIETCAVNAQPGDDYNLYVYDGGGNVLGSGTADSPCNRVSMPVTMGQIYTVTTVAATGSGAYRSAWHISSAPGP